MDEADPLAVVVLPEQGHRQQDGGGDAGADAGDQEQHRQYRVVQERIGLERRQQKAGVGPQEHGEQQQERRQQPLDAGEPANQTIHKGELLLQQVTAQGLDLGPKYHRQPGKQHRHVDLKQHDPHRHHGVELVVEHQLPEGPGAGQMEDEDE